MDGGLLGLLEVVFLVGLVFLVSRRVLLWYWKVEQQLALLTEIRDALRALTVAASASPGPPGEAPPETPTPAGSRPATPAPGEGAQRQRVSTAPRWE